MREPDFVIEQLKRENSFTMQHFHGHDSYELYYLHSGERQYFIQDTTYDVRSGDIVLINRHDLHKTIEPGTNIHERTLINFQESFVSPFIQPKTDLLSIFSSDRHVLSLSTKQKQSVEHILFSMLHEYTEQSDDYKSYLQTSLIQLLLIMKRILKEAPPHRSDTIMPHNKKAAEIVRHLQFHYREPFKLNVLSAMFQVSPYHLCRSFKQYTGFTPVEYIQQIRIKAAQKLLAQTHQQVQSIAEEVGFQSIIHFNRVFKHIVGVPPTTYRRRANLI
jgi:AraC-like DNA-binding protein